MEYKSIKPFHYTQGDIKHQENAKRKKSAYINIREIDNVISNGTPEERIALHRNLDCIYQTCVLDWGKSMGGFNDKYGFNYTHLNDNSIKDNLNSMRAKIESFGMGFNVKQVQTPSANVNVSNVNSNINDIRIDITFEQAREQIEDMTSLTNEQTKEILDKITEIENAVSSKDAKKSKWEKIKPILKWLTDKSFDVGMVILPLLLKLQG